MTRSNLYSRRIVIKPDDSEARDIFLELSTPMLSEIGAKINSSLNRIEIEIFGEYDDVDRIIGQLRGLDNMIFAATHPDKHRQYTYDANLLSKLCAPPVNLDLYASCLAVHGQQSEVEHEQLVTTADLTLIKETHDKIIILRQQLSEVLNRDIERFVISLALEMDSHDINTIVLTAISSNIFKINEYGYQFTISPAAARLQLFKLLSVVPVAESDPVPSDVDLLRNFGFEGGKIVFLKNGQQVDENDLDFEKSDPQ